jgi:tRNA threonylcarbamoyladenosine biosynthesis protein TsaB
MIILTIRTDNPLAEIGLFADTKQLSYVPWQAHRLLAETIHQQIHQLLTEVDLELPAITGLVVFQGPGSFTGLRIGITVANALARTYHIPIVASQGNDWLQLGISKLLKGIDDKLVLPEYGAAVHITLPKH